MNAARRAATSRTVRGLSTVAQSSGGSPSLETGLVFGGSAVRDDGLLTIYLYNASPAQIKGDSKTWTVHRIRVP